LHAYQQLNPEDDKQQENQDDGGARGFQNRENNIFLVPRTYFFNGFPKNLGQLPSAASHPEGTLKNQLKSLSPELPGRIQKGVFAACPSRIRRSRPPHKAERELFFPAE
jgi:hypothetical protein